MICPKKHLKTLLLERVCNGKATINIVKTQNNNFHESWTNFGTLNAS